MEFRPHAYQERMVEHILAHPYCALFAEMGLGKSVVTLTALDILINGYAQVSKALVVAPKSVARNTWTGECGKWDHLGGLRVSVVMGTAAQRRKALEADADIYVTNRDNIVNLVEQYARRSVDWPFDCVVLDESSSFKNPRAKRFRALSAVRPQIRRLIELTGTPAPNGLMDLWAQVKLLDGGERLGKFIGHYRETYFRPGARSGAVVYNWIPKPGAKEQITSKISDICISLRSEDYIKLPDLVDAGTEIELDNLDGYRQFERDCVQQLGDGGEIVATTAVALANKLIQYSSGAVYDDEHSWHVVSTAKAEALDDLLESTDESVLVFYNYRHELERIQASHPEAVAFRGEPDILQRWNNGEIPLLLCHPASVAYGLNMQAGGHVMVWYSPTWDLELYEQACARLHRQGQTMPVRRYHLVCKGTMDEVVLSALAHKADTQEALMDHLKNLKASYGKI